MNRYAFAYLGEVETGVAQFDCGEPELNFFLRNEAEHYVKTGLSAVKLLLDRVGVSEKGTRLKMHNATCRYFGSSNKGHFTDSPQGVNCKACGGKRE